MNELITARQSPEAEILFVLNDVVRISYKSKNTEEVIGIFNEARQSFPPGYEYISDAVLTHLFWAKECNRKFEKHIQGKFFNNLDKYLPGAVKVNMKMNSLHIPDGFVKHNGHILPVEVKIDAITHASVRQITRYIKEYGSHGGIVVAPKLKAPLPNNVIFIEVQA